MCGITRAQDAELALGLGVDALGLNFWVGSKRRCEVDVARAIVRLARGRARVVAVVVDLGLVEIAELRAETGIEWVQLHGDEDAPFVRRCLPNAYAAVRLSGEAGLRRAREVPGIEVLLDAHVEGMKGGTGEVADWALAARIAKTRPLWLAGGLEPENVRRAIEIVKPMGVDVASGIELSPGIKDVDKMRAFVEAVDTT